MNPDGTPRVPKGEAGLEAAKWLLEQRKIRDAVWAKTGRPLYVPQGHDPLSATAAAIKFGTTSSSISRKLSLLKKGPLPPVKKQGRPLRLTEVEDQMLAFHFYMRRKEGLSQTKALVQRAANELLSRRTPPGRPVSKSWACRWLGEQRRKWPELWDNHGPITNHGPNPLRPKEARNRHGDAGRNNEEDEDDDDDDDDDDDADGGDGDDDTEIERNVQRLADPAHLQSAHPVHGPSRLSFPAKDASNAHPVGNQSTVATAQEDPSTTSSIFRPA
ncbi:hypothetical protein F4780DRAFT_76191 [Xylariomycetidae sp. FL0641]|nr:hypothetical protein F4780DRAFT_76191 [Xylariomycetidae sp. FL0641]